MTLGRVLHDQAPDEQGENFILLDDEEDDDDDDVIWWCFSASPLWPCTGSTYWRLSFFYLSLTEGFLYEFFASTLFLLVEDSSRRIKLFFHRASSSLFPIFVV